MRNRGPCFNLNCPYWLRNSPPFGYWRGPVRNSLGPESGASCTHHRILSRARRGRIEARNSVQSSYFHRANPRLSPLLYFQASSCRHQERLRSRSIRRRGVEATRPGRRRHPPVRRAGNAPRLHHAGDDRAEEIQRSTYANSPTTLIPIRGTQTSLPPGSAFPAAAK